MTGGVHLSFSAGGKEFMRVERKRERVRENLLVLSCWLPGLAGSTVLEKCGWVSSGFQLQKHFQMRIINNMAPPDPARSFTP